jgi:hypothetical protein
MTNDEKTSILNAALGVQDYGEAGQIYPRLFESGYASMTNGGFTFTGLGTLRSIMTAVIDRLPSDTRVLLRTLALALGDSPVALTMVDYIASLQAVVATQPQYFGYRTALLDSRGLPLTHTFKAVTMDKLGALRTELVNDRVTVYSLAPLPLPDSVLQTLLTAVNDVARITLLTYEMKNK